MDFTQHHHWGVIEHGCRQCVFEDTISDEYLWEFLTPTEFLENLFELEVIHNFIAQGGGFLITDVPKPLPRFHEITVWAYHPDARHLTWISLQKKNLQTL